MFRAVGPYAPTRVRNETAARGRWVTDVPSRLFTLGGDCHFLSGDERFFFLVIAREVTEPTKRKKSPTVWA